MESETANECFVPRIDMSATDESVCKELLQALTTVGFACLTNTGLWTLADEYANLSKPFFQLPIAEKIKYNKPKSLSATSGFVSFARESLNPERPGDYKEGFYIAPSVKGVPEKLPAILDTDKCWTLWNNFEQLANRTLYLIGLGLGLDDPYFIAKTHKFSDISSCSTLERINWYPKVEKSRVKPGQIRCGEHSDYGSITLLYCSSPGLQVMNKQTGDYVDAGYIEGGIFINIGDLLQRWSGDVLSATMHRVLIPEEKYLTEDRASIAYFCQPDLEQLIETLDGSNKYPPVTSGEWLRQRYAATLDDK